MGFIGYYLVFEKEDIVFFHMFVEGLLPLLYSNKKTICQIIHYNTIAIHGLQGGYSHDNCATNS
jgi:hypothetical protein